MTLNRFIFILVVTVIVLSGCKKSNQFTVSGKITHAEGDTIYLDERLISSNRPVDYTKIDSKGQFKLNGEATGPTYYLLKLTDNNFIILLLDSTENVVVEADAANFSTEYSVEGSLGSLQIKSLNKNLTTTEHKLDSLKLLMDINRGKPGYSIMKQKWTDEYTKIVNDQATFSKQFVLNNPFSMASVYALYQQYKDKSYVVNDLQTMRTAASALKAVYPNSDFVKALYENTLQLLRKKRADDVQKYIQENGENSPDIVLPDVDGKDIALSSLRGKVVLLQFWNAEQQSSRVLNQLLVDAFKKYKNKGFEIYQVNVGNNRSEWIDAIDADQLHWINVSDMEGCVKAVHAYNIQSVPANYLLNRDGSIAAKNLTGPNLDKALTQLLK